MKKTYTYNDFVWYLTEVGACESNFSLDTYKELLDESLPIEWEKDIRVTTDVCKLMTIYMSVWPKSTTLELVNYTTKAIELLYY